MTIVIGGRYTFHQNLRGVTTVSPHDGKTTTVVRQTSDKELFYIVFDGDEREITAWKKELLPLKDTPAD
jgi:hypothetical protein